MDRESAQPGAQVGQGCLGRADIEIHGAAAAEKLTGIKPSEQEIGVGYCRLLTAPCVADGTRRRAGAFRSDAQAAAGVDASQAAAAGADGVNVDDGQAQGQSGYFAFGGAGDAAGAESDVCAGAAHVEGDDARGLPARFSILFR